MPGTSLPNLKSLLLRCQLNRLCSCFAMVTALSAGLAVTLFAPVSVGSSASDKSASPSFSAEIDGKEADVVEALENVVNDTIIHGTYVYDRDQTLGGAEEAKQSKVFGQWTGSGRVYYKVAFNVLAPRNFKASEDQGTITVRFVLSTIAPDRFRIQIDAVFVETERRAVHPSEGLVESSEFKEIADRLKAIQLRAHQDAESKARIDAQIATKEAILRRRQEEVTRLADAEATADDLVKRVQDLRHKVEMRVGAAGAQVKSAPFESAAKLESLRQSTDVVVLILTPYWYGVETSDGHRGWIRKEQLVPLP